MYTQISEMIYQDGDSKIEAEGNGLVDKLKGMLVDAFDNQDRDARLDVHRVLYTINIAKLSQPWNRSPANLTHPVICEIKYMIEKKWEESEKAKYADVLDSMPTVEGFQKWINDYVDNHPKNYVHPVFPYLRDEASYAQLREFFLQETPLEMLFGDILGFMLPGTYGGIKCEMVTNFWDEVGKAVDEKVHRNLRGNMMDVLGIPRDIYVNRIDLFVLEELELINTYLSTAIDRSRNLQLIGCMLATELMIPGRFVYQIEGWKREGFNQEDMVYLTDHVTVDAKHAQDWLDDVVMPILQSDDKAMSEIVLGACRRLDVAGEVCDRLYDMIQHMEESVLPDVNQNRKLIA